MAIIERSAIIPAHAEQYQECDAIVTGMTLNERDAVLYGTGQTSSERWFVVGGHYEKSITRDAVLSGKTGIDRYGVLTGKPCTERSAVLQGQSPVLATYRFLQSDTSKFQATVTGDITNRLTVQYAYDWAHSRYLRSITKRNPYSEAEYGIYEGTVQLPYITQSRQADIMCSAMLRMKSLPQQKISFEHDLRSVFIQEGDVVYLNHTAGIADAGFIDAPATITRKAIRDAVISYTAIADIFNESLYQSEFVSQFALTEAYGGAVSVTYDRGIATLTIYADIDGRPPVQGANVSIGGVLKATNEKGQVRFSLQPGTYTAYIEASGYEDLQVSFSV